MSTEHIEPNGSSISPIRPPDNIPDEESSKRFVLSIGFEVIKRRSRDPAGIKHEAAEKLGAPPKESAERPAWTQSQISPVLADFGKNSSNGPATRETEGVAASPNGQHPMWRQLATVLFEVALIAILVTLVWDAAQNVAGLVASIRGIFIAPMIAQAWHFAALSYEIRHLTNKGESAFTRLAAILWAMIKALLSCT